MGDSLDALQDFHQLSLLVWSHAGKHSGSQHELRRPHVERRRITPASKSHDSNLNYSYLSACPKMNLYLLDELREVLSDNSEGSAAHSEVIALFLLINLLAIDPLLQVYFHGLKDRR